MIAPETKPTIGTGRPADRPRPGQPVPVPPTFSIIVNTCDRQASLEVLLAHLESQTHPDFEVVVVVGPSRDDTLGMLAREYAGRVRVARCRRFNLSVSRNVGLRRAAGEVVAFIDDDAVPAPTWLEQLAAVYEADPEVAGVGGRTYNLLHPEGELQFLLGRISALADQEDVIPPGAEPPELGAPAEACHPRFHGTNMSYRWRALADVGGFDQRFEYLFDDADIAVRLGRVGHRLHQLAEAPVYHAPGTGRNRGEQPRELNWYCWLRSTLYFTLKNGRPLVGLGAALERCREHVASFHRMIDRIEEQDGVDDGQVRRFRRQLARARVAGLLQGLLAPRAIPGRIARRGDPFLPFPRPTSRRPPVVPPLARPQLPPVHPTGPAAAPSDDPLRLCLLSHGYPPDDRHGVARSTESLARGLAELGHEVHVVCHGDEPGVLWRDGAWIHRVPLPDRERWRALRAAGYDNLANWLNNSQRAHGAVARLIVDHRIELVDSPLWLLEGLVTAEAGLLPVVVRVVTSMKQIGDISSGGDPDPEARLMGELEGHFLDRADAVVSNSTATRDTLRTVYGFDAEAAGESHALVPYGMPPAPREWIVPLDAQGRDDPMVLYVGRLERRKGILDLFEAVPAILREFPRARIWVVGADNSRWDGFRTATGMDYPTWFRRRWPDHASRVLFLGFVGEEYLRGIYHECDVFVAPSLYESFGLIYLEAMDVARPTVGCNVGGARDIIVDGETGRLVPPESPAELAAAVIDLLADPRRRREMGLAGRERLEARFTHTRMAAGFLGLYRRVLEHTGAGARPAAAREGAG